MSSNKSLFSIVVPIYNEEDSILEIHDRINKVFFDLDSEYEVIMVNDGSNDDSLELMKWARKKDYRLKIIDFSRNFGHQIALSAGIDHSSGDAVVLIDGNLKDSPEAIPKLIDKWREGFEVVYAMRPKRKENFFKRLPHSIFQRFSRLLTNSDLPIDAGDFSIIDRKVVEFIRKMPERKRFLMGMRAWIGFRQTGIVCEPDPKHNNEPKYSLKKQMSIALDRFIPFSDKPLKLATNLGFLVTIFAFITAIAYFIRYFVQGNPPGFPATIIAVLFLGGIQLLSVGLLCKYIGHIHEEVKSRPLYIIKECIGIEDEPSK